MFDGERLAELRKDKGLTQEQLGEILGVKRRSIVFYETGRMSPSDKVKIKIAHFFNISLDYLMGIMDEAIPCSRDHYIVLPKGYTPEMKKLMLYFLDLLKTKHKLDS